MTTDYVTLTDAFERCEVDANTFAHPQHVGVAYEMLRRYDFLEASMRYARCIDTIATRAGAADKFNVTITLAFLSLIAERMHASEHRDYEEFLSHNPDVLESSMLDQWYDADRLNCALARRVFLLPRGMVS